MVSLSHTEPAAAHTGRPALWCKPLHSNIARIRIGSPPSFEEESHLSRQQQTETSLPNLLRLGGRDDRSVVCWRRTFANNYSSPLIPQDFSHFTALKDFSLTSLQAFLERKADATLSFSMVDHLRWDLSSIFEMAVAEKVLVSNPATRLYTPKHAPRGNTRAMTVEEVNTALGAVELREQILFHMAIFSGFRPGEMLALQRRHVSDDATVVKVEQRVYRGDIDDPKTEPSKREVAIPPRTAELLLEWMNTAVGSDPNAYVFANEKGRPVWRDTLMYDHIRPKLKPHGLEWVDFQVMRATHASIGHRLRLDPKVTADQRGHGVGVAIEEYTKTSLKDRAAAAKRLEQEVLGKPKVVRMPRRKAS